MLSTVLTIGVYIVVISSSLYLVVEIYRFVKRKLTKEPEPEAPQATFNFFDLPDSDDPSKKIRNGSH